MAAAAIVMTASDRGILRRAWASLIYVSPSIGLPGPSWRGTPQLRPPARGGAECRDKPERTEAATDDRTQPWRALTRPNSVIGGITAGQRPIQAILQSGNEIASSRV